MSNDLILDKDDEDKFVEFILKGFSIDEAFYNVFGILDMSKALKFISKKSVRLKLEKIQEQLPDIYMNMHIMALNSQFKLAMNAKSEKVRADALHQFISNTKASKKESFDENTISLLNDITKAFFALNDNNRGIIHKNIKEALNQVEE